MPKEVITRRDSRIDNMRAIGLLLIFLAHANPPVLINTVRSFDVILLVFLSSYVMKTNSCFDRSTYWTQTRKRAKKILLPTYMFIICFSMIEFAAYRIAGKAELFGLTQIINSFLLCENSVGYVWIMKVYFMNFLIAPLLLWAIKRCEKFQSGLLLIAAELLSYSLLLVGYTSLESHNYFMWILIEEWVLCILAYAIVAQDALLTRKSEAWKKYSKYIWFAVLIITIVHGFRTGIYFDPVAGKRPANLQYISYGLLVTHVLIKYIPNVRIPIFEWLSKESLMLYLLHPVFVLLLNTINSIWPKSIFNMYYVKWVVITVFSCFAWWILKTLKNTISSKLHTD